MKPTTAIFRYSLIIALAGGCCLALNIGCSPDSQPAKNLDQRSPTPDLDFVQLLVSSEELLLELTPKLKWLAKDMMNLQLPDRRGKRLFAAEVQLNELADSSNTTSVVANLPEVVDRTWSVDAELRRASRNDLAIWPEFLGDVDYFVNAKFYLIDGDIPGEALDSFHSKMGCAALARMKDGKFRSVSAKLDVDWKKDPSPQEDCNDWQIVKWKVKSFHALEAEKLLFEDVLSSAIPDPQVRLRATRSLHHEFFVDQYFKFVNGEITTIVEPFDYSIFFPDVTFEPPGLSVVDIDQDGWDDLYVCMHRGKNMLFHNQGDGTFREIAASLGLDFEGDSTSAAFADFDNDGDLDMLLGRGRQRSRYLANEDGKFVDRSDVLFDGPLPFMVTSIAIADYNLDGLLDIYLGTYCPIEGGQGAAQSMNPKWVDAFMTPEQGEELKQRLRQAHKILNMVGPPNVLYENLGNGKFGMSKFNSQLESWKRCLQVAWSDYDQDGDPDVYLSNDYAPDQLFRNDREQGFVEVTEELKVDTLGFGMGVSFADYNNDGHMDFYASNMFSKAGSRITAKVPGIDERFKAMAYGNYLYEFDGQQYHQKSGFPGEPLAVSKAGWSWGGQFADFNNDSFLDLYVTNGYHTAPPSFADDMDL